MQPVPVVEVSAADLISRNERDMVEAHKEYYENAKKFNAGNNNENLLNKGQFLGMYHFFILCRTRLQQHIHTLDICFQEELDSPALSSYSPSFTGAMDWATTLAGAL